MKFASRPMSAAFTLSFLSALFYLLMFLSPVAPPSAAAAEKVVKDAGGKIKITAKTEQNAEALQNTEKRSNKEDKTKSKATTEAEIKLSKLPHCALALTTGQSRCEDLPAVEEIKWLLENPQKAVIEKYGDKCKKISANFYDYFLIEKPGLIVYYDYESERASWVKCEGLKELPEYAPGADFAAIGRALGPAAVVEKREYRGYEAVYDAGDVYLRFSSFEKDGKNSDLTVYGRAGMLKYLGRAGAAKNDAKVPEFKKETAAPVKDEAFKDPELEAAIRKIKNAVAEKNYEVLLSFVAEDIKWSFGGDDGKPGFIKEWKLDSDPLNSDIWRELNEIFRLGGGKFYCGAGGEPPTYTTPYTFNAETALDCFEFHYITGKGVNLRKRPGTDSPVIRKLNYEAVYTRFEFNSHDTERLSYGEIKEGKKPWYKVATFDAKTGYVFGDFIRSPIDYRLGMTKISKGWQISFFIAGD